MASIVTDGQATLVNIGVTVPSPTPDDPDRTIVVGSQLPLSMFVEPAAGYVPSVPPSTTKVGLSSTLNNPILDGAMLTMATLPFQGAPPAVPAGTMAGSMALGPASCPAIATRMVKIDNRAPITDGDVFNFPVGVTVTVPGPTPTTIPVSLTISFTDHLTDGWVTCS